MESPLPNKNILSQFDCPICLEIIEEPVTTPCGHNFCNECLINNQQNSCPVCRFNIRNIEFKVNTKIKSVIELLKKSETINQVKKKLEFDVKKESNEAYYNKECNNIDIELNNQANNIIIRAIVKNESLKKKNKRTSYEQNLDALKYSNINYINHNLNKTMHNSNIGSCVTNQNIGNDQINCFIQNQQSYYCNNIDINNMHSNRSSHSNKDTISNFFNKNSNFINKLSSDSRLLKDDYEYFSNVEYFLNQCEKNLKQSK